MRALRPIGQQLTANGQRGDRGPIGQSGHLLPGSLTLLPRKPILRYATIQSLNLGEVLFSSVTGEREGQSEAANRWLSRIPALIDPENAPAEYAGGSRITSAGEYRAFMGRQTVDFLEQAMPVSRSLTSHPPRHSPCLCPVQKQSRKRPLSPKAFLSGQSKSPDGPREMRLLQRRLCAFTPPESFKSTTQWVRTTWQMHTASQTGDRVG